MDVRVNPQGGKATPAALADALRWMTRLLADLEMPYQIVGGLAAVAYGSPRPLNDLDLYVTDQAALERLASAAGQQLVRPPSHHRDEHWDLNFLKLQWRGWDIEVGAASTARVWDRRSRSWTPAGIRFGRGVTREVEGVPLLLMPLEQLLDYKSGLWREVDRIDVEALEGGLGRRERLDSP